MIPQRIRLRGFLSYRDEQEVAFEGASLWMLSGPNGSGKSSVFDAATYALFGHHRGGGQHAIELINKDSDSLVVEFDFLLDGRLYRAKRTLKRDSKGSTRGTQQIFRFDSSAQGSGWVAVADTGRKRDFDAWIADNIGLTYDTFTASVLLLQGKAEKLLDSKPEGRREVLAGIVGLDRYERLHKRADDQRKEREGKWKDRKRRLETLQNVSPEELSAARARIDAAEKSRFEARAEVERLQAVEYQAREWAKLQARLVEFAERWRQAHELLRDAATIESAVRRLHELRDMLPRMKDIHNQRGRAHQARQEIERLTKVREDLRLDLAKREHALKQARDKRTSLQVLLNGDEARQRTVVARLRELAGQMEKLNECERQETDLARLRAELGRLPADPAKEADAARERHDALTLLTPLAALLARFRSHRDELREAVAREKSALSVEQSTLARGKQLSAEVERLRPRLDESTRALQAATGAAAAARTLTQQARAALKDVAELDGAKTCRHCGQPLTEEHLAEETIRRRAAVAAAEAAEKQSAAALQAIRDTERDAREQLDQAEKARNDARVEYSECKAAVGRAAQDVARWNAECSHDYAELPADHRTRVSPAPPADWLATTYPNADDVARIRAEAGGVAAAREALRRAEQVYDTWNQLRARESASQASLTRLQKDLPVDRAARRQEHAGLTAEEKTLDKELTAKRKELRETEQEAERLAKERELAQSGQIELDGKLKQQEVIRDHAMQTSAQLVKTLPEAWRAETDTVGMVRIAEWEEEFRLLESDGTDERGRALAQARVSLEMLRHDRESLETQSAAFSAEMRQDPAVLRTALAEVRAADRACDERLGEIRQQLALLESIRRQRAEAESEIRVTEGELELDRTLAELLGRDRLQLYLVRRAEKQVVELANAVLDRLSGGRLYLRPGGEANGESGSARALELEAYNRVTGERPINVAFLSGSQRFRVAVSLALGIGQYASRQHRPIESVIIDEGFGCLDREGKQVMIQELQNLRSQMKCILLVSHQEEFAEAFADGYLFQLEGSATRVTRVRK